MPLQRNKDGVWSISIMDDDRELIQSPHEAYTEALPRYLTALDVAFSRAKAASEFRFLWAILAIRSMQDGGWNPYETSIRIIDSVREAFSGAGAEAKQHLLLWLYGHVMESSEPYELLANLIDISGGGKFQPERFPPNNNGRPQSPGEKIAKLERLALSQGMSETVVPMKEPWNREFRNAIFHADYAFYGDEIRTIRPDRRYSRYQVMTFAYRAIAYHQAMKMLREFYISSYEKPVAITADPDYAESIGQKAIVIVREGHGVVGLKDGWSREELRNGRIPYRLGRFTSKEESSLRANPELAFLPSEN